MYTISGVTTKQIPSANSAQALGVVQVAQAALREACVDRSLDDGDETRLLLKAQDALFALARCLARKAGL